MKEKRHEREEYGGENLEPKSIKGEDLVRVYSVEFV